jgi:hypothetical protein
MKSATKVCRGDFKGETIERYSFESIGIGLGPSPETGGKLDNQNVYFYPNPFNPEELQGIVRYSLSKPGNITIKLYDITGAHVKMLVENESREAQQEFSTPWDGRNEKGDIVANGVYFYIIESSAGEKAIGKIAVRILTMFFLIPFAILAEEGDGGQAGAFLRIPINARANGMGRMGWIFLWAARYGCCVTFSHYAAVMQIMNLLLAPL